MSTHVRRFCFINFPHGVLLVFLRLATRDNTEFGNEPARMFTNVW